MLPSENLPPHDNVKPRTAPPFDPGFTPMILVHRSYQAEVEKKGGIPVKIGLERENGLLSVYETSVLEEGLDDKASAFYVERLVKFLLWSRGGWKLHFQGPRKIGEDLVKAYSEGGPRDFDVRLMSRVYEKPFRIDLAEDFPASLEAQCSLGGNLNGCRIGFDLGASDYKIAAVKEGVPLFSAEIPWAPGEQADPQYHARHIREGLKKAAAKLPRVDAIGGSSAGVYINNQVRIASLFRSVPEDLFEREVKGLFLRIGEEWGVPFQVINDGAVTALAGMMSLDVRSVLGIAMGSSQAAGFLNKDGHLMGWMDELAFAPVDANPDAVVDEWSGDRGVGANYFSQQAVAKLAAASGLTFPENDRPLPERLKGIQRLAEKGDESAHRIFESIGTYLGYSIPWYELFYDLRNVIILGRVMSGPAGSIIVDQAEKILADEFPETAARVRIHLVDESSRRVGQAVAAASLPVIYGRQITMEGRA